MTQLGVDHDYVAGDRGAETMTASDGPTSTALAMQVGGMSALGMDVRKVLATLCHALPRAVEAAGAVFVLVAVPDADVVASDPRAGWLGELQQRSGAGPMYHALRSGRPMITPDLTRVGPPEVAAAAAETGLVASVVVPLMAGEKRLGGLQLFGDDDHPVGAEQVSAVRPLVEAVSARLVDALALKELAFAVAQARDLGASAASGPRATVDRQPNTARDEPDDVATAVIAVVPPAEPTSAAAPQPGCRNEDEVSAAADPIGGAADVEGEVEDRPDDSREVVGWFSVVRTGARPQRLGWRSRVLPHCRPTSQATPALGRPELNANLRGSSWLSLGGDRARSSSSSQHPITGTCTVSSASSQERRGRSRDV